MTTAAPPSSLSSIVDVALLRGAGAAPNAAPDLLIEIPHGATSTADFDSLAAQLTSPLPDRLVDFFHVNTDAGAPELGLAVARHFLLNEPARVVALLRCRIPRTFIDCNRRIDATPEEFKAGKVTPGLMPWIRSAEDRALLVAAYARYCATVTATAALLPPDGAVLLLHSYAPRSLDVEVDVDIVEALHRAYAPSVIETWPLRPAIDIISRLDDGTDLAPAPVVESLRQGMAALGHELGDSTTYPMHPSTLAYEHMMARPSRALCLEVRRDLLADPFEPFAHMHICPAKVARLAGPIANALRQWW